VGTLALARAARVHRRRSRRRGSPRPESSRSRAAGSWPRARGSRFSGSSAARSVGVLRSQRHPGSSART
jgi:hypothetical protein